MQPTQTETREHPDVNRDAVVRLRISIAERDAWEAAAESEGLSLSEWIRRRVNGPVTVTLPELPAPVVVPSSIARSRENERRRKESAKLFVDAKKGRR